MKDVVETFVQPAWANAYRNSAPSFAIRERNGAVSRPWPYIPR